MFRLLAFFILTQCALAQTVIYKGAVRMPTVSGGTFGYSVGPVARKPDGSFLVMGLPTSQQACIVQPAVWKIVANRNVALLSQSAPVLGWHDPSNGVIAQMNAESGVTPGQGYRVGSVTYDSVGNGYFMLYRWYNVQNASLPSLFRIATDGTVAGVYYVGDYHSLSTSFNITQDSNGSLWSGHFQDYVNGTAGPSAYKLIAFDPSLPHHAKQPAVEYMRWSTNKLAWQAPAPLIGGDHFYRNKPNNTYRPEVQEWFGSWNCRTLFVHNSIVYAVVQRPLGPAWYGSAVVSDGVTSLEISRGNTRGYNTVSWASTIYQFPNLISSGGSDKSYKEISGLQRNLFELDSLLTGNFNPMTGDLYLLESIADRSTAGPVLHWFKLQ